MQMKIAFCTLALLPLSLLAQTGLPGQPYIYVQGKAEIEKPADMVTLRFNVIGRAPTERKANAEAQEKANKVFDLVKTGKITNDDVIAETVLSEPQFQSEENYQRRGKIIGYTVTRPFQVKVRDVTTFPKLVDDLIALTAVEFSGIDGGLQKQSEMEQELWAKAVANAHDQAEKTLKSVSMQIDSVFAISPVPVLEITSTMFPKGQPGEAERVIVTNSLVPTAEEGRASQYRIAPITVTEIVHVIYLISPPK